MKTIWTIIIVICLGVTAYTLTNWSIMTACQKSNNYVECMRDTQ